MTAHRVGLPAPQRGEPHIQGILCCGRCYSLLRAKGLSRRAALRGSRKCRLS